MDDDDDDDDDDYVNLLSEKSSFSVSVRMVWAGKEYMSAIPALECHVQLS